MRVPVSWLKEYVDVNVPVAELAERLTLAGLEVETIEFIGLPEAELPWDPERIVVGEVLAVRPHPDADRLVLVDVAYGGSEVETVVTGAPSLVARSGQEDLHLKVAFAMEGVQLYDGHLEGRQVMTLKRTKIRGVPSRAMVCSEKELGLSDEHVDILYLPEDAPVGTPLVDFLGDAVLEFDIKGPFGHLQSIFGVAREAAALLGQPLKRGAMEVLDRQPIERVPEPDYLHLEIADGDLCPRYTAFLIEGITVGPSPFWLQMRLLRAGMRPINNVVDVTNFVMLEMGQPLHAFDYHVLRPRPGEERPAIVVRRARQDERMKTLDKVERTFDDEMLLITDGQGPVGVAGVMGGLESEVSGGTTDVLLEAANFNFLNVRRTSRLLNLNTEASTRFGRRIDPELTVKAGARAATLMAELAGGTVAPVAGDLYPGRRPQLLIAFDPAYATRVLGVEIPRDEVKRILTALEFQVDGSSPSILQVTPPSHRQDVTAPIDLVEEVGRIWGYDKFPQTLMQDELPPQRANPRLEGTDAVRDVLVGCGLDEVITYSLVDVEDAGNLWPPGSERPVSTHLRVINPLSADRAYLRQTVLPSMLDTVRENLRFLDRVAVFEIGAVYLSEGRETLPAEPLRLGIVMTGPRESPSWLEGQDEQPVDFYTIKGVVETLLSRLGVKGAFEVGQHHAFHPGRCAQVRVGERVLGVMGEIHPLVREAFSLPAQPVCGLEIDLDELFAETWEAQRTMESISVHPPVYEDLAVVVREEVPAVQVRDLIAQTGSPLVRSVVLFDVYRGDQLDAGRKSLAYRLTYQADDRTLTDREVAKLRNKIIRRLQKELGAQLRR